MNTVVKIFMVWKRVRILKNIELNIKKKFTQIIQYIVQSFTELGSDKMKNAQSPSKMQQNLADL